MNNDNVLEAILLLCSVFNKTESRDIKPLTPTEYSRLAAWLHQNKYTPAEFITQPEKLLTEWQDPKDKITKIRLTQLLRRGASMAFALEKWHQQNVQIISRASKEYPFSLREKLKDIRTPLLYCIGNISLFDTESIGFVGSRDIDIKDENYTKTLAQQSVKQGFTVVSGGAKGIDQVAMKSAIDEGGNVIGILADSLLKAATKSEYREALKENRLLLVSPYYPEAGFSVGNAMSRNKYIYALSKGVVVAKSGDKGGTWNGAVENLKKQWVPLWVRNIDQTGNIKLIERGGYAITESKVDFKKLQTTFSFKITNTPSHNSNALQSLKNQQQDIFAYNKETEKNNDFKVKDELKPVSNPELEPFVNFFYQQILKEKDKIFIPKDIALEFPDLNETIIKKWFDKLEEQGLVRRKGRKLAYTLC